MKPYPIVKYMKKRRILRVAAMLAALWTAQWIQARQTWQVRFETDTTDSGRVTIKMLPGEKWWGCATGLGTSMPFDESSSLKVDLRVQNFNNQTAPFIISDKGRCIWSDEPFEISISDGVISLAPNGGQPVCIQAGQTLRDAFLAVSASLFPASGITPPDIFFDRPQYNTWIELIYNQNQKGILEYAHNIVDNGFPAGILMIDDNWQKDYGNFAFKPDRFPDPKGMIDELHGLGFKVMLWVCPFVSPDSEEYRYCRNKGYLLRSEDSCDPAVLKWWNGQSACFDLSNPEAADYLYTTLRRMQQELGVDGFKFDAGDPGIYHGIAPYDGKSFNTAQTELWAAFGARFPYNEFRACWKMGGHAMVQRLGDKSYSWEGVSSLVPCMIAAGMLGHAYTCPDMIGGGEYSSFLDVAPAQFDQRLIVRSCQIHSMMPMMQFSVAPWRILSAENLAICRKYALLHEQMGEYLVGQAHQAAATGEPIVRSMEYVFPGEGFENCNDQYMLGERWLVAPVMDDSFSRSVKLPAGRWQDEQGKIYKGGRTYMLDVPLDRLPYFEKVK